MRVLLAGASGLTGRELRRRLASSGHSLVRLVRREPGGPEEIRWDPRSGYLDPTILHGIDAVINLAGAPVAKRWTPSYRAELLNSRVEPTLLLARAITQVAYGPEVFINASAMGYYGDGGEDILTETSPPGETFLAGVTQRWEAAADVAARAGIQTVKLRTGIVLAPDGGAMAPLLPLIKSGLAGPMGSGRQWWSWITLEDHARAIEYALTYQFDGAINLVAPQPARNRDLVKALAAAFHRPALVPAPGFALKVAIGGFAGEILASQRAVPAKLESVGFTFNHPSIQSAARWLAVRQSGATDVKLGHHGAHE